jgi:cation transport protein ChaC
MPPRTLALSLDLIARAHPTPVPDNPAALVLQPDSILEQGLDRMLAARSEPALPLWVFGYGSLIWQPEFAVAEQRIGTLRGYHRRFCLLQRRFRGSPERPGLVLALDRGGSCRGVAFRIEGSDARSILMPVWRREMRGNGYEGRWVMVSTEAGPVAALTFVANRSSDRYTGRLSDAATAEIIATGCGHLGPSAEYLYRTTRACEDLGILDAHLRRLQGLVSERLRTMAQDAPAQRFGSLGSARIVNPS